MIWQDWAIMVINFLFAAFLIPMMRRPGKPPLLSSVTTATGLFMMAVVMLTLNLWLAAGSSALSASAWTILVIQGVRGRNA